MPPTIAVLLLALFPLMAVAQAPRVREVPLRVDTSRVEPSAAILRAAIREGAAAASFVVFASGSELWTVDRRLQVTNPRAGSDLPRRANWFSAVCSAGSSVLVQVSSYPDSVRRSDAETPRGGFRAGPTPLGVAVLGRDGMRYIDSFRVTEAWPGVRPSFPDSALPRRLTPMVQSCFWTGRELVVGAYGFAAALDLERATARILALDGELAFNRHAVLLVGDTLWTAEDEGGASGGCVERRVRGGRRDRFCVMGFNNAEIGVDALMQTRWGFLSASAAGLVEIVARDSSYTHYQLSPDRRQMAMFAAACAQGVLLGLRDDGIAIVNPSSRRAQLVRLGDGSLGAVHAVTRVGRHWAIGTDSGVVTARLPLPGWRPWRRSTC